MIVMIGIMAAMPSCKQKIKPTDESVDKVVPMFQDTVKAQQFDDRAKQLMTTEMEKYLAITDSVSTTMTINGVPNTPVKIWRSLENGDPVKIQHGILNDAGAFDGVYQYFFVEGKIRYVNYISDNFIFKKGELTHWLDANWNINVAEPEAMSVKQNQIMEVVVTVLGTTS